MEESKIQHQKCERVVTKLYNLFLWRAKDRLKSHQGERAPKLKKKSINFYCTNYKVVLEQYFGPSTSHMRGGSHTYYM